MSIGVARVFEELFGEAALNDLASVHNERSLGEEADDAKVMGDEEKAHVERFMKIEKKVENLSLNRNIESRDGLVAYEKFWF